MEVLSVTKVENRLQYTKFNNKLQVELQRDEFASLPSWKTLLDYLFIVWEPGTCIISTSLPSSLPLSLSLI